MSSSTSTVSGAIRRQGGASGGRVGRTVSGLAVALGCVLFLGGFGWAAVDYRPYTVPTNSMQPTVSPGDKVLALRISGSDVRRGDVVVFSDALWGNQPMVKRVVAVGGDTVQCCDKQNRLTVNGEPITEDYLNRDSGTGALASLTPFKSTVPKGALFVLGDNREVSEDSRIHLDDAEQGAVPAGDVQGRVDATAWPLGRLGMLPRTSAFDAFPGGGQSPPGPLRWLALAVVAGAALIFGGAAYGPVSGLVRRK